MFDAIMSDDKQYVILFFKDKEEPDVMTTYEFVVAYGPEILKEGKTKEITENSFDDAFVSIEHYYDLLTKLVNISGKYAHTVKWYNNVVDGIPNAVIEAQGYFKTEDPLPELKALATERDRERRRVLEAFNKYSKSINLKSLNAKEAEILLDRLSLCDARYRKKVRGCLAKYAKKGEIKTPAEILKEIDSRATKKPSK